MAFVRFKRFGRQEYAYRVTGKWDPVTKKTVQKSKYLGVVKDKEKGLYELRNEAKERERLVLDFGDSFSLHRVLEKGGFADIVRKTFGDRSDSVLALLHYRILYGGAMSYAGGWLDGNYAKFLYEAAVLSSQRISELLADLGDEFFHRTFFQHYLGSFVREAQGIVIDATSLPNQIHMPLTAWGRSGEEIDKQVRFLLVVDKQNSSPIFFRVLAGNIVDVSTLHTTLQELRYFGVKDCFVYVDAGFFSEENVRGMYGKNINFLSRLTSTRLIYKQLVKEHTDDLETYKHAAKYGKRGLFIKTQEIDLFGRTGFAYIVSDPERKGRETKKLLLETEAKEEDEFAYDLKNAGVMILVSSFKLSKEEVVPAYYARQMAEQLFGFEKDDLNMLPLRAHGEKASAGFIFLQFMALIVFIQLKKALEPDFTVEEAMLLARNLKCKVYGKELLINELTKQQKRVFEKMGIIVPNKAEFREIQPGTRNKQDEFFLRQDIQKQSQERASLKKF